MAKDKVKITGAWNAWSESVQQGNLVRPDGESTWILVRTQPGRTVEPAAFAALKTRGRMLAQLDHPSLLTLLHVTKMSGSPAWVYEGFQGVSLARALDVANSKRDFIPVRTILEVAERVTQGVRAALAQGEALVSDGLRVVHPGPALSEVLVDAVGAVRLAGFEIVGVDEDEVVAPQGYGPANPGTSEQRAVYGIAAMLVHLLGGARPADAGEDQQRQDAVIRRAVIRTLARPGEAIPDSFMELLQRALSFHPEDRPVLAVLEEGLNQAAASLAGAGVRGWAPQTIPGLLALAEDGYPDPEAARSKRHIEPADDGSFSSSPGRRVQVEQPPREVKTMVGRAPVSVEELQRYASSPPEATPLSTGPSLEASMTSETDVASSLKAGGDVEVTEIGVPIDDVPAEDTVEAVKPEESDALGGWPLIVGLVVGMFVAVGVGQFAVNKMVSTNDALMAQGPAAAPPAGPSTLPIQDETQVTLKMVSDADDVAKPTDDEGSAASRLGTDTAPPDGTVMPSADADEPSADADDAPGSGSADGVAESRSSGDVSGAPDGGERVRSRRSRAAEEAKNTETPEASTAAASGDVFQVSFTSSDPTMDRMVVRCHKGGDGEGARVVSIVRAGKGNCRVEGIWGDSKKIVMQLVEGPKSYSCFKDGERRCE